MSSSPASVRPPAETRNKGVVTPLPDNIFTVSSVTGARRVHRDGDTDAFSRLQGKYPILGAKLNLMEISKRKLSLFNLFIYQLRIINTFATRSTAVALKPLIILFTGINAG